MQGENLRPCVFPRSKVGRLTPLLVFSTIVLSLGFIRVPKTGEISLEAKSNTDWITNVLEDLNDETHGEEQTSSPQQPTLDRALRTIERYQSDNSWNASAQRDYDVAVSKAQSVERNGREVFQPLRMSKGFVHEAELEQETFEQQLVDMVKQLEPTYLTEAIDWAKSDEQRLNAVLRPMAYALEKPIIKDLDAEAKIRVEHAVDAIANHEQMNLAEKERLRAHLMAPLLIRIRERVHSQISHYVVKLARDVVLKAANSSNPVVQEIVAELHGQTAHGHATIVPQLRDEDDKMISALRDLTTLHKNGILDSKDYNTQKAKLISDWLKYSVNEAGGNANEVLRIDFGGDVRGVTDTGIKHPSPIEVKKKIAMEMGINDRMKTRSDRMNSELVRQLIHSKAQWGAIMGCDGRFDTAQCAQQWREIEDLIRTYGRLDDASVDDWGRIPGGKSPTLQGAGAKAGKASLASKGTTALHVQPGAASRHRTGAKAASTAAKQQAIRSATQQGKKSEQSGSLWSWV